ncbi:uncharacterized protein LOC105012525 isoform X3 [Esox lucius]|uniref:uncharacterized protein LOC105012525 isoform X3 n=1 Tax=Esox lucius TaxID=8010 RepID=UPI001476B65C|nr:uncharacterized protein LOC105012525 isoform X3 [Esox lucius]
MSKQLACQNCDVKFNTIRSLKLHVSGIKHRKKVAELFQSDEYHGRVYVPFILVLGHLTKQPMSTPQPIVGLCLVTICLSSERSDAFYLCHVCEENCGQGNIIDHLTSADHLSNYYNYTDPDLLSFSWLTGSNNSNHLQVLAAKDLDRNGPGVLRMLDMPKSMVLDLKKIGYSKVMQALTQSERLEKCVRAGRPERRTIQDYHRDSRRKHPLLGLQHLVEYCCEGCDQKKSYLCQLCQLYIPLHRVIKHTLSFDHIYWYFKAWHPSTLLTKDCYKAYSDRFKSIMLDLANQAQDISRSANNEIQRVVLEPEVFASVPSVYREALRKLETIREERNEGCLKTSVTPGDKLVPFLNRSKVIKDTTRTVAEAVDLEEELSPEMSSIPRAVEKPREATAAPGLTAASGQKGVCRLLCQNCNEVYALVSLFKLHVRSWKHQMMLGDGPGHLPSFTLYEYMRNPGRTEPIIGVHLISTCLNSECVDIPVCLCHICHECFTAISILSHLTSASHLQQTLMYQSPERLPFGWKPEIDRKVLNTLAWEEETDRGEKDMILKVFFCPDIVFSNIKTLHYLTAIKCLKDFHGYYFVDKPLTIWTHLKNTKRTFPLLGLQFLVQYSITRPRDSFPRWGYLCLLCEEKLSDRLSVAHMHSNTHVTMFLKRAHPGSLEEVKWHDERRSEVLLDLAQQAETIHTPSRVQVIKLERCIAESVMYTKALAILKSVNKRGFRLQIPLLPRGKKLVPFGGIQDQSRTTEPVPVRLYVGEDNETRNKNDNEIKNYKETTPDTVNMTHKTGMEVEKQIGKKPCTDSGRKTGEEPCCGPGPKAGKEPCSSPGAKTGKEPCSGPGAKTGKEPCSGPGAKTGKEPCSGPGAKAGKEPCSGPGAKAGKEPCSGPGPKAGKEPCSGPGAKTGKEPCSGPGAKTGKEPCSGPGAKTGKEPCSGPGAKTGKEPCSGPGAKTGKEPCSGPGAKTGKEPCSGPGAKTGKEPCSGPGAKTGKEPCSGPGAKTGKEPCSGPGAKTGKEPCSGPGAKTGKEPYIDPCPKIDDEPCSDPGAKSGKEPCSDPGAKAGKEPCSDPGAKAGKEPCSDPGAKAGKEPCSDPGAESGKEPCSDPGAESGKEPCSDPGAESGKEPCSDPGAESGKEPCSDPGAESGKEPCSDPGEKTGKEPCSDPGAKNETPQPSNPIYTPLIDFLRSKNRQAVGLKALIECHCDGLPLFYLCQVCKCKVLQNSIISHVTGDNHRQLSLWPMNTIPKRHRRLRAAALKLEKTLGYGEFKVAVLNARTYHSISTNSIPFDMKVKMVLCDHYSSDPRYFVMPLAKKPKPKLKKNSNVKTLALDCNDVCSPAAPAGRFPALWRYLQQSNRQPVIGVGMLTELTERDGDYVLCGCCSHKMFPSSVTSHVISSRHRYYYIRMAHPELAVNWPESPALIVYNGPLQRELRVQAKELEGQEGPEHPQVVKETSATSGGGPTTCPEEVVEQIQIHSAPVSVEEEPVNSEPSQPLGEKKKTRNRGNPVVGVNFLVRVSHRNRKQYYCQLCSVRVKHPVIDHMTSLRHRHSYVKLKYPSWTSDSEAKLFKMAFHLEKVDRSAGLGMQKVEVDAVEFKDLRSCPVEEALSKLQAIIIQQQEPGDLKMHPSTNQNPEDLRQTAPSLRPVSAQGPSNGDQEHLQVPASSLQDQPSFGSTSVPLSSSSPPCLSPSNSFSASLPAVSLSASTSLSSFVPSYTPVLSTEKTTDPSSDVVSVPDPVCDPVSVPSPLSALKNPTHLKDCESPEWWERRSPENRETLMLLELPDKQTEYAAGDRLTEYAAGDRLTEYAAGDRLTEYAAGDRLTEYAAGDRLTEYAAGDRLTEYAAGDRLTEYAAGDRLTEYAAGDRLTEYAAGDRLTEYAAGDRLTEYAAGDRLTEYAAGDRLTEYAAGDRLTEYAAGDRLTEYAAGDRLTEYAAGWTQAEYPAGWTQAEYPARWTQAEYPARWTQAEYPARWTQAEYPARERLAEYQATPWEGLHQFTEHMGTGKVTDQEQTRQVGTSQLEPSPLRWLSVPQVFLHPDTPAAKRIAGPSHLSKYLKVKGLHDTEPIIGLGSVLECRGISQATFFMCVTCAETFSSTHICEHIISARHQQYYMIAQYGGVLYEWLRELQLPPSPHLLREFAWRLSQLEVEIDAQVMLLDPMWYKHVQSAPFYRAMQLLQEQNQSALVMHTATRQQLSLPADPDLETEQGFDQRYRKMNELTMDQTAPGHSLWTSDTGTVKQPEDLFESVQSLQTAEEWTNTLNPDLPQISQRSEREEHFVPVGAQAPRNSEPVGAQAPRNSEPVGAQAPRNSEPVGAQAPRNSEPVGAQAPRNSEPMSTQNHEPVGAQTPRNSEPMSTQNHEPVGAQTPRNSEPMSTPTHQSSEPVGAQALQNYEPVGAQALQNYEPVGAQALQNYEPVGAQALQNYEPVGAQALQNYEPVGAQALQNYEPVGAQALQNYEPVGAQALQNYEPVGAQALQNYEPVGAQALQNYEPVGAQALQNSEPVGAQALQNSEPVGAQALQNSEPISTRTPQKTKSTKTETPVTSSEPHLNQHNTVIIKQELADPEVEPQTQPEVDSVHRPEVQLAPACLGSLYEGRFPILPGHSQRLTCRGGVPPKSTKDLNTYIKEKLTQAVVGLSALIECCCEGLVSFYLCVSCGGRLSCNSRQNTSVLINHVLKYRHRLNYLTVRYPWYFHGLVPGQNPAEESRLLMQIAKEVEEQNHDEPGMIQEVLLNQADFLAIKGMLFDKAVSRLKEIRSEQNQTELLTKVTSKLEPVVVKQEMECQVVSHHALGQSSLPQRLKRHSSIKESPEQGKKPKVSSSPECQAVKSDPAFDSCPSSSEVTEPFDPPSGNQSCAVETSSLGHTDPELKNTPSHTDSQCELEVSPPGSPADNLTVSKMFSRKKQSHSVSTRGHKLSNKHLDKKDPADRAKVSHAHSNGTRSHRDRRHTHAHSHHQHARSCSRTKHTHSLSNAKHTRVRTDHARTGKAWLRGRTPERRRNRDLADRRSDRSRSRTPRRRRRSVPGCSPKDPPTVCPFKTHQASTYCLFTHTPSYPSKSTSAQSLARDDPSQPPCPSKDLSSQSSPADRRPSKPTTVVRPLQAKEHPPNDTPDMPLHPARTGPWTPPPLPATPTLLPPPPEQDLLSASGNNMASTVDGIMFIGDSSLRFPHLPASTTLPRAVGGGADSWTKGPIAGKEMPAEAMGVDSKGRAIGTVAIPANPLKRNLSAPEPKDRDPWSYENRQFITNPSIQASNPTAIASQAQWGYAGGLSVGQFTSNPGSSAPCPGGRLSLEGYPVATYPGTGYPGVGGFTSSSPTDLGPSNTQSQPGWSGGYWGTGYQATSQPETGYVLANQAGLSYPGGFSGSEGSYPGHQVYPGVFYSDTDYRGRAFPGSGTGLGSAGVPPSSHYSTKPPLPAVGCWEFASPAVGSCQSYSTWTANVTRVAMETNTAGITVGTPTQLVGQTWDPREWMPPPQ